MREESTQRINDEKYCEHHPQWYTTENCKNLAKGIDQISRNQETQILPSPPKQIKNIVYK